MHFFLVSVLSVVYTVVRVVAHCCVWLPCFCPASRNMVDVIRRGDILAAMCQEEQGDHSAVTRRDFEAVVAGDCVV